MEQLVSLGHNSAYETEIKATFQVAPISSLRFMCISLLLWRSPAQIVVDIGLDGKRGLTESSAHLKCNRDRHIPVNTKRFRFISLIRDYLCRVQSKTVSASLAQILHIKLSVSCSPFSNTFAQMNG